MVKQYQNNVHFGMEGREHDRWEEAKRVINGCYFEVMSYLMKMFLWSMCLSLQCFLSLVTSEVSLPP